MDLPRPTPRPPCAKTGLFSLLAVTLLTATLPTLYAEDVRPPGNVGVNPVGLGNNRSEIENHVYRDNSPPEDVPLSESDSPLALENNRNVIKDHLKDGDSSDSDDSKTEDSDLSDSKEIHTTTATEVEESDIQSARVTSATDVLSDRTTTPETVVTLTHTDAEVKTTVSTSVVSFDGQEVASDEPNVDTVGDSSVLPQVVRATRATNVDSGIPKRHVSSSRGTYGEAEDSTAFESFHSSAESKLNAPSGLEGEGSDIFPFAASVESDPDTDLNPPPAGLKDDVNIFIPVEPTPRGKRTIDVLLTGLAQALGYELKPRMNNNRKSKQTPAPTQPPPQTTATPPAPKPTKVSNAEPTTPKGHNASDVDLQAQKEESESEEDDEENEDEDRKGSARLTDGRRDEDGTLDGYFRSTAGNYFRKEYDRIRESERNPSWANNYHDDDDKGKYAAPSKREEEPEQQHFRYFIPEYDGDDSKGSRGALLHNFGATSEGPSFDYGKPFSYSFGIPFQEPQPSKEPVQFQGPSASYDDQPFYNTPTAVYPGPTAPYASEPKQPFNVEKGRPYHGPPLILVGGTQQFSVEKGRPEEGQESHQEGKTQPFNVEKGRPGGYDSRERTYQGIRPYPGPGSSSQQNRYEETQTSSHPDHTQAIFSPLRPPPPPPPPSPSPSSQPQPLQQDPKVLNTFQASVAGKLPIISTSKPQMAQILNEMEGTKQISLWPPPFDYSFDVTEATVTEDKPIRISKQKSVIRTKSTQVVGEPKDWQKAGYLPGDKVLSYASPESIPPPLDETGHPAYPTRSSVENTPKNGVTESELRSALWFPPGRESLKASADEESRADSSKEESNPQDVEESRDQGSGEEEQESSNEEYNGGESEEEARPGTADYYDPRQPPPNHKPPAAEQFSNRGPTVQPYSGVPQGSYSNARGPPPYSHNYHHSPSHSKEQSQAKYSSREQPYREDSRENYEAERQPQSPPGTYYTTRPLSSKEPSSGEVLHPEEPQRPGSQEYHSQRPPSTENQGHYITAGPPPNPQSYYNSEQYPTLYSTSVEGQEEPSRKPPGNSQGFFILDEPPKNQKSSSESTSYQQPYSDSKEFYQNTRQPFEAVPARESVSQSPPSKSAQEYLHVDQPSYTNIQPADAENQKHNNADRTQQYTNAGSPASYSHSPHTSSRESVNSEEPNQQYIHSQQPEGYSNSQPEAPRGSYQNSAEYQRPQTYNDPPPPEPTKTEQSHAYKLGAQQVPLTEAELLASVEADPDDALFALLSADLSTKQSVTNNPTTPEPINLNDFLKFWQSQSNTSEVKINPQGSQSALKAQTLYQLMHQDLSTRPPSINDVTDLPLDDPLSWFRSTEAPKSEESKKEEVPTKKPPVQPTETKTNSQVGAFIGLVIPNPLYVAAGAGGQTDVIASPTSPGFVLRAAVPEVEYKSFPQRKYVEIVRTTATPTSEEEVSAKPSEIDEERQPYPQNSFITSTEATFYHIKPLPTSSPKPFSRDVYPSDNTIYYQSPSEDLKEIHKPYSYYRKESDETKNSNPPFLYHENHTKEFSVPTTTKTLSYENEEVFSSTEKPFSLYDQEKDEETSTQKSISLYEKSKSEYESSTHKPLFSYFHTEKSLQSSSERPFPYYKKPDISDSATHKAFHSSLQQDETTTTEATPLYEQQEQVIISTIKPYIPPAHHYGIRLPPSTTTTTTTTTTAIPPRSATKQLSTRVVATPPTGHYGIRLPPPPPPPPPPSPYRRRPRPRLSPEEMARRHHIEFLRHSHHPDDYDHGMYEEYPETDGARFLFGDEEDEEAEADERTSPSEDVVPANGATRHWRSSPYQPPDGSRDFYRPSGHPRTQGYQPHGSFSLQSPLSDDYTSLDYYYVDPPPPRPRPSARLAQREAEEAAQAVKKRADAGSPSTPATPNLSAEATAASVPSTSKSLNKETISRVSKIHVTGKDLLVALHAQNAEVASLNTSFLRLSETLPPRQDIHDKLEAIYFTISELSSHLDRAKNPEIATTSSEVLELLKDISRRIPVSAPNHELLLNKMDAIANEYAAIVAQSTAIQKRTDELKEIFEYQHQTVESCVAKLVEREDAKIAVTTVVPTEAQHGGEVGEDSVKNRLDEIVSCLSHLMDETTTKDALLLDQNTQVSDIHDLVSQLLERAVDNSRGSEDLPSISAALTQLLAKLKIWDSQLNVQQGVLNEINHNMSSAGHKMADGLGAVWECQQEILNNVKEISEKINMSMANCPGPDNQLALQIFPKIEEWLKLIVSDPLIKNNELIEEMFRSLEAVIPRLELKRIDDDSERIEISGTIDYIKEELALIQASNSEILSKFDVISNTIDLDGLECKTQLSDIQSNVMVLKKLQADCGTSLRKQISSIRPYEFDKDLELIFASLDKIHIHLVSLTNDITSKPELNKIGSMLLEIKDNQVSSMIELSKQVFNISEKNSNESDVSKVRSELTKMFVAIQNLPEILSSVFEVKVKKELAEFRGVLNENLAYMKELMHNEQIRRKVSEAAGRSARTTGAVEAVLQVVAKERSVVEGVATLHAVAQDLLHELRSRLPQGGGEGGGQNPVGEAEVLQFPSSSVEAPPASLLPCGSTDSPQGGGTDAAATAAATAVLLAAHLSGETLRKQSAEAAVREARRRLESLQCACRVQLDAYAAYAAYTTGTDCRHRRRRTPARRLPRGVSDTATDNASAVNRRSKAFSFREYHSAHRRIRSELPKSTVSSSSSEKFAATRRRIRRLRSALRKLEQLSKSMETHYQNMLRELGNWIMQIANYLNAPDSLQALKFPDVPSHIGTWFLQICTIADWSFTHLKVNVQRESSHMLKKESEHLIGYQPVSKNVMAASSVIIEEIPKSSSEKSFSKKSPKRNGKSKDKKVALPSSLILATLQDGSKSDSKPVETPAVSTNGKVSLNGRKVTGKIRGKSMKSDSTNGSDKNTSDTSPATYTIVKEDQRPGLNGGVVPGSSDDLSLSVGSLGSTNSLIGTSDAANLLASSHSDDGRIKKRDEYWKEHKMAEEKLIAILDGLKEKILSDSPNEEQK